MSEERKKALSNLKTARGQVDGIMNMLDEGRYCIDVSNQIMATIAILKKANLQILSGHLQSCVKNAIEQEDREDKLKEIEMILAKISK